MKSCQVLVGLILITALSLLSCVTPSGPERGDLLPISPDTAEIPESPQDSPVLPEPAGPAGIAAGLNPEVLNTYFSTSLLFLAPDPEQGPALSLSQEALEAGDFILQEAGSLHLDPELLLAEIDLEIFQDLGGRELFLVLEGQMRLRDLSLDGALPAWTKVAGEGILPDQPSRYLARINWGADLGAKVFEATGSFDPAILPVSATQVLIFPRIFLTQPLSALPAPLQLREGDFALFAPGLGPQQGIHDADLLELRILNGDEVGSSLLEPEGVLELRPANHLGLAWPAAAYYLVDGGLTESRGYATSRPLRSLESRDQLTWIASAPVLGAEHYELLAGGSSYVPDPGPMLQVSETPEFLAPGYRSIVFSAIRQGRPLLELSYELDPGLVLPERSGSMMKDELSNQQAAELLNFLLLQGHAIYEEGSGRIVDRIGGETLAGLAELDYGEQFGLRLETLPEGGVQVGAIPGRETHPAIGISWTGAQRMAWALNLLSGMKGPFFPALPPGPEDLEFWRLPSEKEWLAAAENPAGFRVNAASANYYRSFDPFEDPNPPHTRNGGPTSPVDYFPPDSRTGIRGSKGNAWEWALDVVEDQALLGGVTGEVDKRPVMRRVLGGAWNTQAGAFGPAGNQIPRGSFAEDGTSWSIGIRYIYISGAGGE